MFSVRPTRDGVMLEFLKNLAQYLIGFLFIRRRSIVLLARKKYHPNREAFMVAGSLICCLGPSKVWLTAAVGKQPARRNFNR